MKFRDVLIVAYLLQLVVVVAWLLGAMYRDEQSVWFWQEFGTTHAPDLLNEILIVYVYLLFYSAFFTIPYVIFKAIYKERATSGNVEATSIICGLAFLTGFLFFHDAIFAFMTFLPDAESGLVQWLIILWIALAVFAFSAWHGLAKSARRNTQSSEN